MKSNLSAGLPNNRYKILSSPFKKRFQLIIWKKKRKQPIYQISLKDAQSSRRLMKVNVRLARTTFCEGMLCKTQKRIFGLVGMGYESIIKYLGCIISRSEEKLFQKNNIISN
jgi:hypothetical protein